MQCTFIKGTGGLSSKKKLHTASRKASELGLNLALLAPVFKLKGNYRIDCLQI